MGGDDFGWEEEAQRANEKYHIGRIVYKKLNELDSSDAIEIEEFFNSLSTYEYEALQAYNNQKNELPPKSSHTPKGTTSFMKLVDIIAKRRHGKNVIARRSADDRKSCDLVMELITEFCNTLVLTGYVRNKSGDELKIEKGYWNNKNADQGYFNDDLEPSFQNCIIYFQNKEVAKFLKTLFSSAERNLTDKEENFFLKADNWSEVGFVRDTQGITVKVKGTSRYFKSEQFKNIFPSNKNRKFLCKVIKTSGVFSFEEIHNMKKDSLKGYVCDLRKDLRELFGIAADPIPSTGKGGYKTMFSATHNVEEDFYE